MAGFDSYNTNYRSLYEALGMMKPDPGGIMPGGSINAGTPNVIVNSSSGGGINRSIAGDSGLINNVRKTVKIDAYGNPVYPSTFPERPGVPFSNTSRDRLQPNANPNIPGAGVAANDWFSQPGSYVNQMGTVKVSDLPALKKPPLDITVRGGNTTNTLLAMMGGSRPGAAKVPKIDTPFPGAAVRYKTAIGPQMGMVGGKQPVTKVAATMKPGYQRGNGLLAFLTQNNKQPMSGGLSGLLSSLFTQPATAVGSQLDTQPSRSDRYTLDTLPTFSGPRSGVATNGYVYQNGQNVGTTRAAGESAASQYDRAAAAARASSPDNGGNPSWW